MEMLKTNMKKIKLVGYLLPSIVAWFTNRRIREERGEENWDSLLDYWKQSIAAKEIQSLEKVVDDLYASEMQRKDTVESKAASLFEAIGFAISFISIVIVFIERGIALILLLFPMANFVLAGICSWLATRIGEFFLPTLEAIKDNLELAKKKPKNKLKTNWIAEKLANTEMNRSLILIKSNWLVAAYQHFMLGILSTVIVFAIVVLSIL